MGFASHGFVWHVALRYFRSSRSDSHIRTLSSLTAAGLAVGTAALVLALAALAGFQKHLLDDLERSTPALQIELTGGGRETAETLARVATATRGVASAQELLYAQGWLGLDHAPLAVRVIGYETAPPAWIPASAAAPSTGLILPRGVALRGGLAVGDLVRVVSPRPGLTPVGPQPRTRTLPVAHVYGARPGEGRSTPEGGFVLMPIDHAEALFTGGDRRLDLALDADGEPDEIAGFLSRGIDPAAATVVTRSEANRALFVVLGLERALVFSAVALIVAVASFALLAELSMVLSSKRAEVGVLSAMGARPAGLRNVFLLLGALLSVGGAGVGGVVGTVLAVVLDRYRLLSTPSDVYVVDHVPFLVRWPDVLVVLAVTVAFTTVAAALGARRVGALDPVEAMRSART